MDESNSQTEKRDEIEIAQKLIPKTELEQNSISVKYRNDQSVSS